MNSKSSNNSPIYLDYHATTPIDPRVADLMLYYMTTAFGNASSTDHIYGDEAANAVSQARNQVAKLVGASAREVIFTSGATESINLAIQGTIIKHLDNPNKPRIAFSPLEHKAVLDTCQEIAKKGSADLISLQVDSKGRLDLEYLEQVCQQGLSLLCVMAANNEIGNIYPVKEIGEIAQKHNIPFLCDASQAAGKIPIDFEQWGITYLAISGHKFYAPKGIGALIVRKGHHLEPIIFGGGHQKGLRSGTLNVPGIVGLGEACRLRQLEMEKDEPAIAILRDKLQNLLQEKISNLVVNGDVTSRLAGNLHLAIPTIPNSAIIARIRDRLAISTGSACSSGVAAPSHVLRAINLPDELIEGSLRIGLGKFTTNQEIDISATIISDAACKINLLMNS
ncbi:cysteine desulfurase family protein [Xenococcus sp. PCC 7305]|uniref:cysteine desulfurase family protein n=1 Tax=Xenococcus sp. PCC 7305 TaxID=102125 RepID=UPI0002AC4D5B|nr:cysteine desulfurase family protein [Xenococcus sp. PCC 7305]ELS01832.1 cysteine desulfurase family protein [Xenococcus sp. PCC 7305]